MQLCIISNDRERKNKKPLRALEKLDKVCSDIQKGVVKKRGWNAFSNILGKTQNIAYPKMEAKARASFRTDDSCIGCGLCVKKCPMHNLELVNGKVKQNGNCTLCYRCVNICPKQSCTVYFTKKPKKAIQRDFIDPNSAKYALFYTLHRCR